jgi:hypothetical protein
MESHSYYRKEESLDSPPGKSGFNREQALKYVKAMTFPRKTGSEGEQRAAETIVRFLKESGYEVREEAFFIRFPPWLWMKSPSLFFLFSLFIAWLSFEKLPLLALLFSSAFLLGIGGWEKAWIHFGERAVSEDLTCGMRSKNILASIPGGQGKNSFFLMAHYDSKSQSLNLYLRASLFLLGCMAGAVFSLWIWIHVIPIWMGENRFSIPAVIQGCFFLAAGVNLLLLSSKMRNKSDGALDNASGVGVLLEVARSLMQQRPKSGVPMFLFTGAEELGLLGSLMFRKRYGKEIVRSKGFFINIDGVGQKGKIRVCSSREVRRRWLSRIRMIAKEKGICLRTLPFHKGILMDHLPFCHFSIVSFSLTSISKEGWQIHTTKDQFPLVQKEGLGEMGELILGLIESLKIANCDNAVIKK